MDYISTLQYEDRPDYSHIERLFLIAMIKRNIDQEEPIEWHLKEFNDESNIKNNISKSIENISLYSEETTQC